MAHFTVRRGGMIEATCDNLAAALHKADMRAKRYREIYTVHRGGTLGSSTRTACHAPYARIPIRVRAYYLPRRPISRQDRIPSIWRA
jgi:hypothetical protein